MNQTQSFGRGLILSLLCGLALLLPACGSSGGGAPASEGPTEIVGDGPDTDGDNLSSAFEIAGWEIVVDDIGFGPGVTSELLARRMVTSDPGETDTDGDGLDDGLEFVLRTDPRSPDTDGDGLTDAEEHRRWKTSPVSVDTDGDARGPDRHLGLPPNALLFDGLEFEFVGTSPSLADTDGDGKTDYEEFDDPLRSPLIADLPQIQVDFEGEVDIRLFVQYAETEGREEEYGSTFSTTEGSSSSKSDMESEAVTVAADSGGEGFFDDIISADGLKGAAKALAKPLVEYGRSKLCEHVPEDLPSAPSYDASQPEELNRVGAIVDSQIEIGNAGLDVVNGTVCEEATPETTTTTSTTLTEESSRSATESHSEFVRESRSKTETAARGQVKVGARIRNTGTFAWELRDLFVTMMQWQPNYGATGANNKPGSGAFRTLATLRPVINSVVLGPGQSSEVMELTAEDVNPEIIKGFLARPKSIAYAPAGFELQNERGINFEFLTEQTFGRTATLAIAYDDGRLERFQLATNVARYSAEDEAANPEHKEGELAGIRMGEALRTLGVPFTTTTAPRRADDDSEVEVEVLDTIRGLGNVYPATRDDLPDRRAGTAGAPTAFWSIHLSREDQVVADQDFSDVVIRHGDRVRIVYVQDRDGDGVSAAEESLQGSTDSPADELDNATGAATPDGIPDSVDTDRDGLTDFQEIKLGWDVIINAPGVAPEDRPRYRAFASPVAADVDGDGLTDAEERAAGTDPNNEDTDDDTVLDGVDPFPLTPARILYVKSGSIGDGSSWSQAYGELRDALAAAAAANADGPAENDVAQIWVARGVYTPHATDQAARFELPGSVSVYGGFEGGELRRGARDPDPLTNGTVLSGDLNADDTFDFANHSDNSRCVVYSADGGAVLDGFTVSGGNSTAPGSAQALREGGLVVDGGSATLRNLLFRLNRSDRGAGGVTVSIDADVEIRASLFIQNLGWLGGALQRTSFRQLRPTGDGHALVLATCEFADNEATLMGGAVRNQSSNRPGISALDCRFLRNRVRMTVSGLASRGGAIVLAGGSHSFARCEFIQNSAEPASGVDATSIQGGAVFADEANMEFLQCAFVGNQAEEGSAIDAELVFVAAGTPTMEVRLTNCTVGGNISDHDAALLVRDSANWYVYNCVIAGNVLVGGGVATELQQLRVDGGTLDIRTTLLEGLSTYAGLGNIDGDPRFVSITSGNLRLEESSDAIDQGNDNVDFDTTTPGLQRPSGLDLGGSPRVSDGDGDGTKRIDMGAYEFQPK